MAKRIVFASQLELPVAANSDNAAVRKQEFDAHAANNLRHLPPVPNGHRAIQAGSIEQHSLQDQIAADKYLASKNAIKHGIGIKLTKISPDGTT